MVITVHAGHAAPGNKNCGAVGYCAESYVDREITRDLIDILRKAGHEVIDCTVDSGLTQSGIITAIKKKINAVPKADFNISIHLNSSQGKHSRDNKTTGTECLINSSVDIHKTYASNICKCIEALGFRNRGVKQRTDLGVLKGIKNGGINILVETFFCNDEDDFLLYRAIGSKAIAMAIANGILGGSMPAPSTNKKEAIYIPQPTLKKGNKGEQVRYLQTALNYLCYADLEVDGSFGPKTVDAVRKWQAAAGLKADAVYGPLSYDIMKKMILAK